ncbi:MAG: patatin-like phospholipase family protein [Dehalococcoidia bacterium]
MAIAFGRSPQHRRSQWGFQPDLELLDPNLKFRVRISPSALADLHGWIRRSARVNGADVETGGYLLGEFDDAAQVCWISEVTGPPTDSESSPTGFRCGIEGMKETIDDRHKRSGGAVGFVGHWHTHPDGAAHPSSIDHSSMLQLAESMHQPPRTGLLLIVGRTVDTTPEFGAFAYARGQAFMQVESPSTRALWPASDQRNVGLALSGGGFRAAAFHLGCLRALHDRGLLDRISVVSGVSGGALVAGLYASSFGEFEEFDARLRQLLRHGLQGETIRRLFLSPTGPRAFVSWTTTVGGIAAANVLGLVSRLFAKIPGVSGTLTAGQQRIISLLRMRSVTRTTALSEVLREWYGERLISDDTRDGVALVLNAVELSTRTAFRFGSVETGDWRFGSIVANEVLLRDAVAASAAHPVFLPAVEMPLVFKRNGKEEERTVTLADGGLYDNLGVSVFDPARDPKVSYNIFHPKAIISCDAGLGMPDPVAPGNLWPSRMMSAMNALFSRATNLNRDQLFEWRESGEISDLLLAYLGSRDEMLPKSPSLTVRREAVVEYPTNLSAMSERDIETLAARGEQQMRVLMTEYAHSI